ncbi:MAG TPA: TadG family pilus assembly protein [Acetobacteraceae bacterium]|nr:TadG family pilus assembly protein [Acetobacteraceae bacterium]
MSLNFRNQSKLAQAFAQIDRRCGRDRGGMATLCAVMIPVLIGLGTLAIDQGYYGYRNLLLKQTTQNAALAAAEELFTYYTSGTNSTIVSTAQTYALNNMPSSKYGTVVTSSNVVLGSWSGTAFTAGGTNPTAVQVTGLNTAANSNAVPLFLGSFFGRPSVDISYTVVASYGSGKAFNTIVINDMSQSFGNQLADQASADQQILNCVKGVLGATSYFGITFTNGHAFTYQPLTLAQANYTTLTSKVTALTSCSAGGNPNCSSGSNVGSGIYSAIQQFNNATYTGTSKTIVIITDGVPNAKSGETYTTADGVSCGKNCSDTDLQNGTKTQATAAKTAGINISTIYYSGTDTDPSVQSTAKTFLAGLVAGTGTALVAPTTAQLDASYAALCSSIPSVLKLAN